MDEGQKRGQLTKRVKMLSTGLLRYEIDKTELMLMPYYQYQMMNEQRVTNINKEERDVIEKWKSKGFVDPVTLRPSPKFWDAVNKIMFLAYVNTD